MTITYVNLHATAIDTALNDPRIKSAATAIVVQEGGLTNDANDAGGITNFGISLRYARGIGLDLNGDGHTTASDIMLVTSDEAIRLYVEDFFIVPKISMLSDCVWPWMLDFGVNSGPPRAIMGLQATLNYERPDNTVPGWSVLTVDGVLGGMTTRALASALTAVGWPVLQNALCDNRQDFCNSIVRSNPGNADFIDGWTNRINSFRI